jgi:hypothetical protein
VFQVAGLVVDDAVAQCEVLRPGWRADRIGLDEAERLDGLRQRLRYQQASRDGKFA